LTRFRLFIVLTLLLAALAAWRFVSLGRLLYHEDPLEHADLIYVLAGMRMERAAEAGNLYLEGWAPRIILSRSARDAGEIALQRRGIHVPTEVEIQAQALLSMGVPAQAIDTLDEEQISTASESQQLRELATASHWRAIIVVTSKLHTGRARLAILRNFAGTDTKIIMRASRYDEWTIDDWWSTRGSFRFVLFESQKLLAYWLGLAD
jgi:uncharacterized SAM-binding protein YcdF (DUF218 family)